MRTRQLTRSRRTGVFPGAKPIGPWVGWSTFPGIQPGPRAVDQRTYLASVEGPTGGRAWSAWQPSRSIGPYELSHKIGEGGSSVVYAAYSHEDGRRVAIKVPKGDVEAAVRRIKADFRAARLLRHRHVVRMHQLLPVGDRYAAVMEWLGGPLLREYVRGDLPPGQLPPLERLRSVVGQLAAGLAHIHAAGWVHGDVKPDNIHLTAGGTPRWLDFDLASSINRPLWMPASEHVVGTFSYLSPEAIEGQPAAAPADMFSFGRLLSKLICGRLPSWDPSMGSAVSAARIRQQLPADTPRELLALCTQLVHVSPNARPTAAEVYHQLSGNQLPPTKLQPLEPPSQVTAAACQVMQRADQGKGTLLVVETSPSEAFDLEGVLAHVRSEEPRLLLTGHCDRNERTPLRGFDAILDQLALWIHQLPPRLRSRWRQLASPALARISPALAGALQIPAAPVAVESREATQAGREAVVRLLARIAEERTVVLAIHNLQYLDDDSQRLLVRLVQQMPSLPLVIVGTADRRAARVEYEATLPRSASETRPVTLHVGC